MLWSHKFFLKKTLLVKVCSTASAFGVQVHVYVYQGRSQPGNEVYAK